MAQCVYLHIGAVKTGTSALQAALVRNRAWLAERGFVYPDSPEDAKAKRLEISSGNALALASALNPNLPLRHSGTVEEVVAETVRVLHSSPGSSAIYSSEHLMFFREPQLRSYCEGLREHGVVVRILFWVRDLADHALSTYSQLVKRHRYTEPFADYCRNDYNPMFKQVIETVSAVLGKDLLLVASYESDKARLFAALCRELRIDPSGSSEIDTRINRSLTRYETEVMRVLNRSLETDQQATELSDAILYAAPDKTTAPTITPQEEAMLAERLTPEISAVNAFCGMELIHLRSSAVQVFYESEARLTEFEEIVLAVVAAHVRQLGRLRSAMSGLNPPAADR